MLVRKRLNLTQRQASYLLGVREQTVSEWERGISIPNVLMLPKITEVYQCSADEIIQAFQNVYRRRQEAVSAVDHAISDTQPS